VGIFAGAVHGGLGGIVVGAGPDCTRTFPNVSRTRACSTGPTVTATSSPSVSATGVFEIETHDTGLLFYRLVVR